MRRTTITTITTRPRRVSPTVQVRALACRRTLASATSAADPRVIAVTVPLPERGLRKLRSHFRTVHYHPQGGVPTDTLPLVELWMCDWHGLPKSIQSSSQLPALKHIQLSTAGADKALRNPLIKCLCAPRQAGESDIRPVSLSSAAGVHVLSIPSYVVAMIININHQLYRQIELGRLRKEWPSWADIDQTGAPIYYNRQTRGKIAGFLTFLADNRGYGALGRESARLCKALGMRIIAANTSGRPTQQNGYIITGTGDADGSLPEEYFSTADPETLKRFLTLCDVLVCTLPSTPETTRLLDRYQLGLLPKDAVFINVGRGDLIESGHLLGAAIDVTEPDPLPKDHPLWSHPKLLITPHLSGDTEGGIDLAVDVFLANAEKLAKGMPVLNRVDWDRGY